MGGPEVEAAHLNSTLAERDEEIEWYPGGWWFFKERR